jgi:hypothetical protein
MEISKQQVKNWLRDYPSTGLELMVEVISERKLDKDFFIRTAINKLNTIRGEE